MLYIFYGSDYYRRNRKVEELEKSIKSKGVQFDKERFYLDEDGQVEKFNEFVFSQNLFGSNKKIIIISGSKERAKDEVFRKTVKFAENNPNIIIFFNENWGDKKINEDLSEIFKNAKKQYFGELSINEIIGYVLDWAKTEGVKIEKNAIETISLSFNNDLGAVMSETKKLSLLEKPITGDFIKSLNEYADSVKIFDFSRIFFSKSKTKEKLLFYEMFDLQKTEWASVFNYFAKAAKDLANIKKLALQDENIKKGLVEYDKAILSLLLG